MNRETVNKTFLLLLVLFISALFLTMIRSFLMALFLAGIFSALAQPVYRWLVAKCGGRRNLASIITVTAMILVVVLPLLALTGVVVAQAIKVGQTATPWVQARLAEPMAFEQWLSGVPGYDVIEPYRETILQKAGEAVGQISGFLINGLRSATLGTVQFFFMLFVLLYAMFYFLMDGHLLLDKILYYMPLEDADERRMLDRFTSVTRATIKGTAVVGILQGALSGVAFWLVGLPSAVFWGAVMTVMSVIPGIGTALVWGPAAVVLAVGGHYGKAIFLVAFCGLVVGSIDNFLRPRLVGKDTEMHDLMILFGTLGGIALFGVLGVIIGPIIAALFITVWEIYGFAFQSVLPEVGPDRLVDDGDGDGDGEAGPVESGR